MAICATLSFSFLFSVATLILPFSVTTYTHTHTHIPLDFNIDSACIRLYTFHNLGNIEKKQIPITRI